MTENDSRLDSTATAETTQSTQQPRLIAQRYALLGELGRGGMGVVWRGEDRMIGRQVAIKELRGPDDADEAAVFQERVLREVRTGGRINDPAVVTVYDVVTEGQATFIVMELVDAPTLSEVVQQQGPLPAAQVASIGDQVLAALQAAHEAGIVHRDVKPGNIMVAANGRVKLTDFGIAQAVDDPRLTTSGNLVGSPAFMSPERVAGSEAVPASDLWSLGAALFFAVEGIVAFERTSTAATLHAIMNEVPYLTHAQGPLASAIMGLLIAGPDARLSTQQARGLLAMAASQAGQPTPPGGQASNPTQAVSTAVYPGQPPTMVGGQAMVGQQGPPSSRNTGRRGWWLAGAGIAAVVLLVAGLFIGKWVFGPTVDERMLPTLSYGKGGKVPTLNAASASYSCLNTSLSRGVGITESNWTDCEDPHIAELFASVQTYGGSTSSDAKPAGYPGRTNLASSAEAWCTMVFTSNRVKADSRASLSYRALVPTEQQWAEQPEPGEDPTRSFHCVLSSTNGSQLTGSARNELR